MTKGTIVQQLVQHAAILMGQGLAIIVPEDQGTGGDRRIRNSIGLKALQFRAAAGDQDGAGKGSKPAQRRIILQ